MRVRLDWSATDAGSGIKSYQLQVSVNGVATSGWSLVEGGVIVIDFIKNEFPL